MKRIIAFLVLCGFVLSGCATISTGLKRPESNLANLSIGDSEQKVIVSLGKPDRARGGAELTDGRILTVDEYSLFPRFNLPLYLVYSFFTVGIGLLFYPSFPNVYFVQYIDDKLVRWGQPWDWRADITGDITIRHDSQ